MPQEAWSPKRERQYEHIKARLKEHGQPEEKAEEIAARTVNTARARAGEAQAASPRSIKDLSSGRRGGLRSHSGSKDRSYEPAAQRGPRARDQESIEDGQGAARAALAR
jgi:hypothetical protein